MQLFYDVFPTWLGWYAVLASGRGVRRTSLKPSPQEALDGLGPRLQEAKADPGQLEVVRDVVTSFLKGEQSLLDQIDLDVEDAPLFYKAAWQACRSIPLGETRSYAWLAVQTGKFRAYRAAGQAMAKNRAPLIVPCHRVIGSNGRLHGYGGGLELKDRLLKIEFNLVARAKCVRLEEARFDCDAFGEHYGSD